jgi:hypothetical protein
VRRADLRDVHLQARVLADEDAGRARVIEVDVAEQQMTHVAEGQGALFEGFLEARDADRGAAVVEREPSRGLDEVAADDALGALVVEVDQADGAIFFATSSWPRR